MGTYYLHLVSGDIVDHDVLWLLHAVSNYAPHDGLCLCLIY